MKLIDKLIRCIYILSTCNSSIDFSRSGLKQYLIAHAIGTYTLCALINTLT